MSGDNTNNQLTTLLTTNANLLNNILNNIEPSIQNSLTTNNTLITNIVDNLLPLTNTCITLGQTTELAAIAATASQQNSQQASLAVQAVEALNLPTQITILSSSVSNLQSEVDTISSKINNQSNVNNTIANIISQIDDLSTQVTNLDSIVNPTVQPLDFNNIENLKPIIKHNFLDENDNLISTPSSTYGVFFPKISENITDPNRTHDLAYFVFSDAIWAFDLKTNLFIWTTNWSDIISQDALLNNGTGGQYTKVYTAQANYVAANPYTSLPWAPPTAMRFTPSFAVTPQGGRLFFTPIEGFRPYGSIFLIELDSNTGNLVNTVQIPLLDDIFLGRVIPGYGFSHFTASTSSATNISYQKDNKINILFGGNAGIQYVFTGRTGIHTLNAQHEVHDVTAGGFLCSITRYADGTYPEYPTSNFSQAVEGFWQTSTGNLAIKGIGNDINFDTSNGNTPTLVNLDRSGYGSGIFNIGVDGIFAPLTQVIYDNSTADILTTSYFTRQLDDSGNLTNILNPIEMFVPVDYGYKLVNLSDKDSSTDAYHGDYQYLVAWNAFNLVDQNNKSYSVPANFYLSSLNIITSWSHYLNRWYNKFPVYNDPNVFTRNKSIYWIEQNGWGPDNIGQVPNWLNINPLTGNYGYSMFIGNLIIIKDIASDGNYLSGTYTIYTINLDTHLPTKIGSGLTFKSISRIFVDCKFMQMNNNDPILALNDFSSQGVNIPILITQGTNLLPSTTPGFIGVPSNTNTVTGFISSQLLIGQLVRKFLSPNLAGTYVLDSMEADRLNTFGGSIWSNKFDFVDNAVIVPVGNGFVMPLHIQLNVNNVKTRTSPKNWFVYSDTVNGTVGLGSKWGFLDLTPPDYSINIMQQNRDFVSLLKLADYYISTSNNTALKIVLKIIEDSQIYICNNMHKLLPPYALRQMTSTSMVVDVSTGNLIGRCETPFCSDGGWTEDMQYLEKYGNFTNYSSQPPYLFYNKFATNLNSLLYEFNSYPSAYNSDCLGPLYKYDKNTYYCVNKFGFLLRYNFNTVINISDNDNDYKNINFKIYKTDYLLGSAFAAANNIGCVNYSFAFSNKDKFGNGVNSIMLNCKNFAEVTPSLYYVDNHDNIVSFSRGTNLMQIFDIDAIESFISNNNTIPTRNQFITFIPVQKNLNHLTYGGSYSFIDTNNNTIGVVIQLDGLATFYNFNTKQIKRVNLNTPGGRSNFIVLNNSIFVIEERANWGVKLDNFGFDNKPLPYAINQYAILPKNSICNTQTIGFKRNSPVSQQLNLYLNPFDTNEIPKQLGITYTSSNDLPNPQPYIVKLDSDVSIDNIFI